MVICFTGHRPDKLGGYDWNTQKNKDILNTLLIQLCNILKYCEHNNENLHCIVGGALGTDQMAMELCLLIRQRNKIKVTIEIAIPFKDQYKNWFDRMDINRYMRHIREADTVTYVDTIKEYSNPNNKVDIYYLDKMQLRNKYMVDKSDKILSVWNGTKGGTKNCIDYAKKQGKQIINTNPKDLTINLI